jgi:hypothetical protein
MKTPLLNVPNNELFRVLDTLYVLGDLYVVDSFYVLGSLLLNLNLNVGDDNR